MRDIRRMEILAVFILLILLTSLFAGCLNDSSDKNMEYGENFEFTTVDGSRKHLSEYQGKIVILDFMGANCAPCQGMMMVLKQLSEDYPDELEIVSIDVWIVLGETSETLQQFINLFKQEGVDLDWTFGVDDKSGTLYYKYASSGVPIIYILDENGNIYYTRNGYKDGYSDYLEFKEKIDELLE